MLDSMDPPHAAGSPPAWQPWMVLILLVLSALAVGLAPLAMPEGYSWVTNAISESAAQGQSNAWVARLGFLLYGFAVLWLAGLARHRWGVVATLLFGTFAVFMVATAAFSHRPWRTGVPVDDIEDLLHSITATGMGLAFAAGVVFASIRRTDSTVSARVYDFAVVALSVILPLGMVNLPEVAGALQRLLFLFAYVWFALEAAHLPQPDGGVARPGAPKAPAAPGD